MKQQRVLLGSLWFAAVAFVVVLGSGTGISVTDLETNRSARTPGVDGAGAGYSVAIVAAAANDTGAPWFTDPQDRLIASGQFEEVAAINAYATTPSYDELVTFDAVLVWSNLPFADAAALGDNLADYVDAGGGVVVAGLATSSSTLRRALAGRWQTDGYEIIPSGGGNTTGTAGLGTVHVPGHTLLEGVVSFSGGSSSFRPVVQGLVQPAVLVAEWSDGAPLVAVREGTARVDLGFYPPSDTVLTDFWDGNTDGGVLLVNAVRYATENSSLPQVDDTPDPAVGDPSDAVSGKSRYLSFSTPVATAGASLELIRVTLVDMPGFPSFNGEQYWVGTPGEFPDEGLGTFIAAQLTCDMPDAADFSSFDLINVYGAAVVPGSTYSVQRAAAGCPASLGDDACFSEALVVTTGKWGDVAAPYGGNGQPDFTDIAGLVDKFQALASAPPKARAQLAPNVARPSFPIDFGDIAADIDSFSSGGAYPFDGPSKCQ